MTPIARATAIKERRAFIRDEANPMREQMGRSRLRTAVVALSVVVAGHLREPLFRGLVVATPRRKRWMLEEHGFSTRGDGYSWVNLVTPTLVLSTISGSWNAVIEDGAEVEVPRLSALRCFLERVANDNVTMVDTLDVESEGRVVVGLIRRWPRNARAFIVPSWLPLVRKATTKQNRADIIRAYLAADDQTREGFEAAARLDARPAVLRRLL